MFKRLLVPLDGTRRSASVVPLAVHLAQGFGCNVKLMVVIDTRGGETGAIVPNPWSVNSRGTRDIGVGVEVRKGADKTTGRGGSTRALTAWDAEKSNAPIVVSSAIAENRFFQR